VNEKRQNCKNQKGERIMTGERGVKTIPADSAREWVGSAVSYETLGMEACEVGYINKPICKGKAKKTSREKRLNSSSWVTFQNADRAP